MATLAHTVILGEVAHQGELDRAVSFLKAMGLVVWGEQLKKTATDIAPGSEITSESSDHYVVCCFSNDYKAYSFIFKRCSAGFNTGESLMLEGKRKVSPALWDVHTLPEPQPAESPDKKLRHALEFYARESNYEDNVYLHYDYSDGYHTKTSIIDKDRGAEARKALDS